MLEPPAPATNVAVPTDGGNSGICDRETDTVEYGADNGRLSVTKHRATPLYVVLTGAPVTENDVVALDGELIVMLAPPLAQDHPEVYGGTPPLGMHVVDPDVSVEAGSL